MAEVGAAVAGGAVAPFLQPIVRWFDMHANRRRQVDRLAPALVYKKTTHICHELDRWLPSSRAILREDGWLKEHFWQKEVSLDDISPALIHHNIWTHQDAQKFEGRKVSVLGPNSTKQRLALIVWGIRGGVLCPDDDDDEDRSKPAIIDSRHEIHECDGLEPFVVQSEAILEAERWVASAMKTRQVKLAEVAPVLRKYHYCKPEDLGKICLDTVLVVGVKDAVHRLALILWGATQGILLGADGLNATRATDGAIDLRSQVHICGWPDGEEAMRDPLGTYSTSSPDPGIPISATKIILGMTIDVRTRPTPTLLISERVFRDLGALMHDRRGAFEIQVQCSLSRSLSEIAGVLAADVLDAGRSFELGLLDKIERLVHTEICFRTGHYKRPVRPSDWSSTRELVSGFPLDNQMWFDRRPDGAAVRFLTRRPKLDLSRVSVNINAELPSEIRWTVEVCKLLGCPVQYVHHEFGLVWISDPGYERVILGNAELADAKRCVDIWSSSDSSGRNDSGDRFLSLWGWHSGPKVKESGADWRIDIYHQDRVKILELVGYGVLAALPLNLC